MGGREFLAQGQNDSCGTVGSLGAGLGLVLDHSCLSLFLQWLCGLHRVLSRASARGAQEEISLRQVSPREATSSGKPS